jgi:hypothetical protein
MQSGPLLLLLPDWLHHWSAGLRACLAGDQHTWGVYKEWHMGFWGGRGGGGGLEQQCRGITGWRGRRSAYLCVRGVGCVCGGGGSTGSGWGWRGRRKQTQQ